MIRIDGSRCYLGLIDALGHGPDAAAIADLALTYLKEHFHHDLCVLMEGLHRHLRGTRGAVAALCLLNTETGELSHAAIGNITVKIVGPRAFTFVSRDGIIGYMAPTPREQRRLIYPGDILLLHSDGIREHFDTLDCADLFSGTATTIAQGILDRFGKMDDDASCITLRYLT